MTRQCGIGPVEEEEKNIIPCPLIRTAVYGDGKVPAHMPIFLRPNQNVEACERAQATAKSMKNAAGWSPRRVAWPPTSQGHSGNPFSGVVKRTRC